MKYVIVGCGRVGSTLAKLLVADKHDVIVVDENPAAFKRLGNRFGGAVEVGTGIDYDVLKRAGADRADGFVAVTDGDNRNVMAALIAQRMFRIPKIVARIYDPPRGQLYRDLGIETFSPTTLGAQLIRDRLADTPYQSLPAFDFGNLTPLVVTIGLENAGKNGRRYRNAGQDSHRRDSPRRRAHRRLAKTKSSSMAMRSALSSRPTRWSVLQRSTSRSYRSRSLPFEPRCAPPRVRRRNIT